jgi:hypothetical protein
MTDPKKNDDKSPVADSPAVVPAPDKTQELTDEQLTSVMGGTMATLPIDDLGSADLAMG